MAAEGSPRSSGIGAGRRDGSGLLSCEHEGVPSIARSQRLALAGGAVALTALIAVVVDLSAPVIGLPATLVDVAVGAVFVATAVLAGPWRERLLMGSVGVAWLAGSVIPVARSWHQGVFVLAVALFPTGRLGGRRDAVSVALAIVVASGTLTQAGVAVSFVLAAVIAGTDRRTEPLARSWPTLTAALLASVLGAAWVMNRRGQVEPALVLAVYESALVLVA